MAERQRIRVSTLNHPQEIFMFKRLLAALFALIAATAFAAVDINKANQAELESVKGIGCVDRRQDA